MKHKDDINVSQAEAYADAAERQKQKVAEKSKAILRAIRMGRRLTDIVRTLRVGDDFVHRVAAQHGLKVEAGHCDIGDPT